MLRISARTAISGASLALVMTSFVMTVGTALAATGIKVCVPKKEGSAILTPKHSKCKRGFKLTVLGAEGRGGKEGKAGPEGKSGATGFTSAELETLKSVLPFIKFVASGVAGKPTIQFSGVNVQVVSGAGKTNAVVNGAGNLVIGYDENPSKHAQTGSHDLIVGEDQEFTSFGGIVAGRSNAITGEDASISGGHFNTASGGGASVSGGDGNVASGTDASVSGGEIGTASGFAASVTGGAFNTASANRSAVSGGKTNTASSEAASVSGGFINDAEGARSSISGGEENRTQAELSWIGGGHGNGIEAPGTLASLVAENTTLEGVGAKETACVGSPFLFLKEGKC